MKNKFEQTVINVTNQPLKTGHRTFRSAIIALSATPEIEPQNIFLKASDVVKPASGLCFIYK